MQLQIKRGEGMRFSPYSDLMQRYYGRMARECAARRRRELAAVDSPEKALAYVRLARERIRTAFGPLPERRVANVATTGVIERDDVRMEKILFECAPGFHMTGILYRPLRLETPAPGVLALLGHNDNGKAARNQQSCCVGLARKGAVVFSVDPIGQGERKQYPEDPRRTGCVWEHNMAGKQLSLCGEFFGAWRLADAKAALDCLAARPEVDGARLAVTGASGGGTLSSYLFALDDRLSMAAPACYLTTFRRNFENELPTDAEQIPPGLWAAGGDMADFLIARAPNPALILAVEDDFFDPRGAAETLEEARRIYALLGAEKEVELFVGEGGHCLGPQLRRAAYEFFTRHWFGRENGVEEPFEPLPDEKLFVTPGGRVTELPGEMTLPDYLARRAAEPARNRSPQGARIAAFLKESLQAEPAVAAPEYRVLRGRTGENGLSCLALQIEPEAEAFLQFRRTWGAFHLPPGRECTLYLPHVDAEEEFDAGIPEESEFPGPLFALDVRGSGKSAPLTCDRGGDYFDMYGSDYFYDATGRLLNSPYLGGKVRDLFGAIALLRSAGYVELTLAGRGLGGLVAAYAAGIDSTGIRRIRLRNVPRSWSELMQKGEFLWPQSHLIPGMLREFDLDDLHRLLAKRCDFRLFDPWDGFFRPLP